MSQSGSDSFPSPSFCPSAAFALFDSPYVRHKLQQGRVGVSMVTASLPCRAPCKEEAVKVLLLIVVWAGVTRLLQESIKNRMFYKKLSEHIWLM